MTPIMEESVVKLEVKASWAEVTINRPQSLNALNADVLTSIILTAEKISKLPEVKSVIITGEGEKAFVAGADIASMSQLGPRAIADYVELGQRAMRALELLPVPVIAAVNGFALGGGLELALSCDLIVASSSAKVGQPEVNLGIIPGFGGTQRLIQRAGLGTARRLVITGELISAEEALRLGIVDYVHAPADLLSKARELCGVIAKKGPLAVRGAKKILRASQEAVLLSGLRLEVEEFLRLFASADREEGMEAFLKKREAAFRGL
jgi:enoyl-CoA hydratase